VDWEMVALTPELMVVAAVISVVALGAITILVTRNPNFLKRNKTNPEPTRKESEKNTSPNPAKNLESSSPPTSTVSMLSSVTKDDVQKAEEDLRILSVEKEIVSYALTRLYEAQAEGKITEKDKEKLLGKYKVEMTTLEKNINDKQMVVRLHELETTQADLIKLFQEKFDEINRNIETIRGSLGLAPQLQAKESELGKQTRPGGSAEKTDEKAEDKSQSEPDASQAEEAQEAKEKPPPRTRTPRKLEAEEKVEAIQQEVLKILERLEKQEAEE
jgi:hypothetical protein